jgi:DNA-binding MarR family transcriptional regulator
VEIPELKAMQDLAAIFATLEEDEVQRVLRWANEKYRNKSGTVAMAMADSALISTGAAARTFSDLPSLFDAAKPTNGLERLLVAAYFYQVIKGEADFDSQSLNGQLKHLGYPSANVTRDMGSLVDRSPKWVIQTRKEGTTQQARKRFRLTTEGAKVVEAMLAKAHAE